MGVWTEAYLLYTSIWEKGPACGTGASHLKAHLWGNTVVRMSTSLTGSVPLEFPPLLSDDGSAVLSLRFDNVQAL